MNYFIVIALSILFGGCVSNVDIPRANPKESVAITQFDKLDELIPAMANNLFKTKNIDLNTTKVAITSFVDLSHLNKTTTFGRVLAESMISELHTRGFKIVDFRGQDSLVVNADGEFHLTRDIEKLRKQLNNSTVLVATYSKFDHGAIAINARIINFDTGDVLATSRLIYFMRGCEMFDMCSGNSIKIVTDNCSKVVCPSGQCIDSVCK
mgnify:CR=1 FL=1